MLNLLLRAAAVWTAVGLAGGLFYRELTKQNGVPGGTQLAVVHTHALVLGTLVMLVLLALVGTWRGLESSRAFRFGVWVWQVGLALTTGGMLLKGSLQVLDSPSAGSPALAGVSGLGHITLTAAFILLFVGLRTIVPSAANPPSTPVAANVEA
jgi:nitric oxide reductase large subunit